MVIIGCLRGWLASNQVKYPRSPWLGSGFEPLSKLRSEYFNWISHVLFARGDDPTKTEGTCRSIDRRDIPIIGSKGHSDQRIEGTFRSMYSRYRYDYEYPWLRYLLCFWALAFIYLYFESYMCIRIIVSQAPYISLWVCASSMIDPLWDPFFLGTFWCAASMCLFGVGTPRRLEWWADSLTLLANLWIYPLLASAYSRICTLFSPQPPFSFSTCFDRVYDSARIVSFGFKLPHLWLLYVVIS